MKMKLETTILFIVSFLLLICIGQSTALLTDGMVAYYPLEQNLSDYTGINTALINTTNFVYGNSLTTYGSYAYRSIGVGIAHLGHHLDNGSFPAGVKNFSMSAFFNESGTTRAIMFMIGDNGGSDGNPSGLFITKQNTGILSADWYGGQLICMNAVVGSGVPYHVAVTYDTLVLRCYINGVLINSTAKTNLARGVHDFVICGDQSAQSLCLSGWSVDNPIVYNRTLNLTEIQQLSNGTNPIPITVYSNPLPANITTNCSIGYTKDVNGIYYDNISFQWNNATSLNNGLPFNYNLSYGNILSNTTFCTTQNNNCTNLTTNTLNNMQYSIFLRSCDLYNCSYSNVSCQLNICQNNWVAQTQPCVSNTRLTLFTDGNNCTKQYNVPITNGTYQDCTVTIHNQTDYSTDILILGILFLFLLISIVCGIFVHEAFFGLSSILLGLMLLTFQQYNYPDILKYVTIFMILVFSGMWILISRVKRN